MLKKLIMANTLLAVGSSLAVAGGMGPINQPCYTFQAGPYVGASVGPRINISGNPFTYAAVEGTLSAGLGHLWNQRFYLAGEVFGGDSVKLKTFGQGPLPESVNNVRSGWSYGFDLLPGVMINDHTLAYLRGGVVNTQFISNTNIGTVTKSPTGWQLGLGMQTNVYKNLDARVEYIYSRYQKVNNPLISIQSANQANLGLVYKFV